MTGVTDHPADGVTAGANHNTGIAVTSNDGVGASNDPSRGGSVMAVEAANRMGPDAGALAGLLSELAAADELITDLVAENEELRFRLTRVEGPNRS